MAKLRAFIPHLPGVSVWSLCSTGTIQRQRIRRHLAGLGILLHHSANALTQTFIKEQDILVTRNHRIVAYRQVFLNAKASFNRNSVFLQTAWLLQILALSRKPSFYLSHHFFSLLLPLYFLVYFLMHILLLFLANIIGSSGVITIIIKGYKQAPVCKFLSLLTCFSV